MADFIPDLWIIATLAAATFQVIRFMVQKVLATATLSAAGATFSRFIYSAPLILLGLWAYLNLTGLPVPNVTYGFWIYGLFGGVAQIFGTICVVALFKQRNFAVGTTFMKVETIFTVLMGWILLGEGVSGLGFIAIGIGLIGVFLLSAKEGARGLHLRYLANRATALGLASGALFSVSAVCYRGASLLVETDNPMLRAGVTLAAGVVMQAVIMSVWLLLRDRGEIVRVWRARRVAVWIGLLSMGGSFCWFLAFTLQNAAYVKGLGQVELLMGIAASTLFFNEKILAREWAGMAAIVGSALMLILVI